MTPLTTITPSEQELTRPTDAPSEKRGSRRHLENLDVVRGLAILGVLLFHSVDSVWRHNESFWNGNAARITLDFNQGTSFWLYPSVLGWLGVAVFFALSGFCIHYSQGREERPRMWLDFFLKRGFRIIPAYWIVLIVLAIRRVHWHEAQSVREFLFHLFFIHNLNSHDIQGINPSFWSIAIEAQLYVVYPIIWYATRKIGWASVVFMTLLIELVLHTGNYVPNHLLGISWPPFLLESPFAFWFSWTVGAWAAELHRRDEKFAHAVFFGWICILAGFAAASWKNTLEFAFPSVAAGTALLLLGDWNLPGKLGRLMAFLGIWSYSLYLIHQPILQKIGELGEKFGVPKLLTLVCVWGGAAMTVFLAGILFRLLEQPSIELGRRVRAKLIPPRRTALA